MADLSRNFDIFEGTLTVNTEGRGTLNTAGNLYSKDLVYRHEGLHRAIYNHNLMIKALNPATIDQYVAAKRGNLNSIAINLRDLYKMEYKRNLDSGYTQEYSKKKALKVASEYKARALKQHNNQFPEEFKYEQVMSLLEVKRESGISKSTSIF